MSHRLRGARPEDLEALFRLASTTHMLNLPADRDELRHRIELSIASFAGTFPGNEPRRGEYLFVLEDGAGTVRGTSAIIGQHGTRLAPHISFEVGTEENYSASLDVRMVHRTLELVHSYEGPTEIGGLLVDPAHRKTPTASGVGLGAQLSYVRFLYMAMRRERFQPTVLSEMLPPKVKEGWSPLWDALGAKFTGLSYEEADRRWRTDKEFVEKLFPTYPIYVTLLPKEAQEVIGAVDEGAKPALTFLTSIGFRYANHVDPFDGGPHYVAERDEITLIKRSVRRTLVTAGGSAGGSGETPEERVRARRSPDKPEGRTSPARPATLLIGVEPDAGSFRAVATAGEIGETTVAVPAEAIALLEVAPGAEATAIPIA